MFELVSQAARCGKALAFIKKSIGMVSSHMLKAQSDVCNAIFKAIPELKPGVIIHFHDIFYPFEYPLDWIINRKYSWNELYSLRALLMYNSKFEVIFFNDYFFKKVLNNINLVPNYFLINPGGSFYMRVVK